MCICSTSRLFATRPQTEPETGNRTGFGEDILETGLVENRFQPKPVWTQTGFALSDTIRKPVSNPFLIEIQKRPSLEAQGVLEALEAFTRQQK